MWFLPYTAFRLTTAGAWCSLLPLCGQVCGAGLPCPLSSWKGAQLLPLTMTAGWPLRLRNTFLLAACADMLAARFTTTRRPTSIQADLAMNSPARSSGVGVAVMQAVTLAVHLGNGGGRVHPERLAADLASAWQNSPHSSPTGTRMVLAAVTAGTGWQTVAAGLRDGQGSCGSDAAVRAIAAGLLPGTLAVIAETARAATAVTHTHPLGADGAAVTAVAVALAARGEPSSGPAAARFLAAAAAASHGPQFPSVLPMVRTLVLHRAGPAEAAATLRPGTTTLRTVPAALTAYLRYPGDPAAAIRYAVMLGGPNRAIAAITAALAGAACPTFTPPAPWLPSAAARQHIRTAASLLAGLADTATAAPPPLPANGSL